MLAGLDGIENKTCRKPCPSRFSVGVHSIALAVWQPHGQTLESKIGQAWTARRKFQNLALEDNDELTNSHSAHRNSNRPGGNWTIRVGGNSYCASHTGFSTFHSRSSFVDLGGISDCVRVSSMTGPLSQRPSP